MPDDSQCSLKRRRAAGPTRAAPPVLLWELQETLGLENTEASAPSVATEDSEGNTPANTIFMVD